MTEDYGRCLQFALYVRDAVGIVDDGPDAVPALVPAVTVAAGTEFTGDDVRAWRRWFGLLVAEEATGVPGDPLGRLLAAGPTPALGSAAAALAGDAERWGAQRTPAGRQTRARRLAINHLVTDVERELGRRATPFTLHVVTLPVAGVWAWRPRHDLVLLSAAARNERLSETLAPVVREVA